MPETDDRDVTMDVARFRELMAGVPESPTESEPPRAAA
jgi:hypothetical protein